MQRYGLAQDPVADPAAIVQGTHFRITVLTDGLLRLEWSDDGAFEDRASTFAVRRRLPVPDFRVIERADVLEIVTDRLHLTYDRGPFSAAGLSVRLRGNATNYRSVWRFGEPTPSLGGTARTLDMVDGRTELEPGVVSRSGLAEIDDSSSFCFTADGWIASRAPGRRDLYVFAYGLDHEAALRAFHAVSGHTPLIPRWALGTWWSRYHRYSAEEYLTLMDRFREEGIPIAVSVIDMDWHRVDDVDPSQGSGWTGYSWNRTLFPEPEAFLAALHERGKRVTLNVHPADGIRSFEDAYPAMCAALGREPGDPIAFDPTDRAFLDAYFDVLHRGLETQGVDFWWIDWQQGRTSRMPGVDPLWVLNHFHYLDNAESGRRPLTFSRYAGPGSHRSPIGFSGDTVITWASLAFQPEFTATAANIGYGWWSHDIGGHMWGSRDDELTARWVQLGVFSPILRLHSTNDPFMTKEPWTLSQEARAVVSDALRLRHRLIPYLHTMNHRAATEDLPLVRPLYHRWPRTAEAHSHPNEFLFGSDLLVAPITEPADRNTGLAAVTAWLPEGRWVDLFDGLVYDGGRELVLHRPLTSIPVLAPTGAIVPLDGAAVPADDPQPPTHLEVLVVVGADGHSTLIEDDGALHPAVARTRLRYDQATGTFTVAAVEGAASVVPAMRDWTISFVSGAAAEWISTRVGAFDHHAEVQRTGDRIRVQVRDVPATSVLEVRIGSHPRLPVNDVAGRVRALLDRTRMPYLLKSRVLAVVTSAAPLHVRASHLAALGVERPLELAISEILFAS